MTDKATLMMDRATLLALAERVEQAPGPDRELDMEISVAVGRGDQETHVIEYVPEMKVPPKRVPWRKGGHAPDIACRYYTAAIAAAATLVPEGWVSLHEWDGGVSDPAFVRLTLGQRYAVSAKAMTPAMALTAAALRASAAMMDE